MRIPSKAEIDRKQFYRFTYLQTDHWKNLRLNKLASVDAHCGRCGKRDLGNDVHHLRYKSLYDVELSDLVVLCRKCHELAHRALDGFREEIKSSKDVWDATIKAIKKVRRQDEGLPPEEPDRVIDHEHNAKFKALRLAGLLPTKPKKVRVDYRQD